MSEGISVSNLNWSLEFYEEKINECNSYLKSLDDYQNIPLINSIPLENFRDGAFVRYQGMVQDMLNPEYYSCSYTVVNTDNNEKYIRSGKFRDVTQCKANEEVNMNEDKFEPKERLVFYCIPIPGINNWVLNLKKGSVLQEKEEKPCSGVKRNASDSDNDEEMEEPSTSQTNSKKNKLNENEHKKQSQNESYNNSKYFPLPTENGLPCIVKVYEEEEKSNIILNDRIEVIGFLSLSPALEANWVDKDSEDKELNPPPSLVPRIHAIFIKKLVHFNPLLKQIISYGDISSLIETARSDLHLILTQLLFEDTVAADYLLCHLLSRIYIRNESHTIGKLSLNLFNVNFKNFGSYLNDIMKTLVTNSHYVPLSVNLLNSASFIPKKDYETNRLWSGLLQLCEEVHVILDETKMNEGQLNNVGCLNVAALQRLFRDQEVQYDFGYYPVTYSTNIPIVVLSEGKSMFEADVRLKVKSESSTEANLNESFEAIRLYLNEEVSNRIRIYLTATRLLDFELGEDMVKKIGEDYVSLRQQDKQVTSSDLHTLLIISRLLALSHGRTALQQQDWTHALEMETERKLRLR